jgi:hypothetical protein
MTAMDKSQDADLEKGYETIEDASVFFDDDDRAPMMFDDSEDDLFDTHGSEESEFDYEPEGAFLD